MLKFTLNDRYIKGTVAFQNNGNTAIMSYVGEPKLPLNAQYDIDGSTWRVVQVRSSDFNPQVTNVDLLLEKGE